VVRDQQTEHAWWSRLRHQGLLLSPVVMLDKYSDAPAPIDFRTRQRLRDAYTRFSEPYSQEEERSRKDLDQSAILQWTDVLLEHFLGHEGSRLARQHSIPERLRSTVRIGSRTETLRPHRVVFADGDGSQPALLVMADTSRQVGRGRGRTAYARFVDLLRGTGQRLGVLTNGFQLRLVYTGLDFEAWCEWECGRFFEDEEGEEELAGLRQLLGTDSLALEKDDTTHLLAAVEESRKKQADLSSVLRENIRRAVELFLEEVSKEARRKDNLLEPIRTGGAKPLDHSEVHEALLQATVRVVMRLVVCLFAESRGLLPAYDPVYSGSYGVRSLYELLERIEKERELPALSGRVWAWNRLMALFRLVHDGSEHGNFVLPSYGGLLFRPGREESSDPVSRALFVLEHHVSVSDITVFEILRKLLRGPLPVMRGRQKALVEGPVDYTQLDTEFIGLIYEGLLDYRLRRADEAGGPQLFLNIGREPVLPLVRLESMVQSSKKELKDLLTKLGKEKADKSTSSDEDDDDKEESTEEEILEDEEAPEMEPVEEPAATERRAPDYEEADQRARRWARQAIEVAGIARKKRKREPDSEYQAYLDEEAKKLIKRVVATGEFYLVRAGNVRKGTGTFYTKRALAAPTAHRTLEPLCYQDALIPRDDDSENNVNPLCISPNLGGEKKQMTVESRDHVHSDSGARSQPDLYGDSHDVSGTELHNDSHTELRNDPSTELRNEPSTELCNYPSTELRNYPSTELCNYPSTELRNYPSTELRNDPDRELRNDCGADASNDSNADMSDSPSPRLGRARVGLTEPTARIPKPPDQILSLKICDPACGSASFLVAALRYLTDALYDSLRYHCDIENSETIGTITLPLGKPRTGSNGDDVVPFPPHESAGGQSFEDRVKAILKRYVVERCIYGVDINPLAVELARVSLWVETMDRELPMTFLDHKIKVGNSLVGCWLDRVMDYPLRAWEREGGDGKNGPRTDRIETFLKGERTKGRRSGDGIIKQEMRKVISTQFAGQALLFEDDQTQPSDVVEEARKEYQRLHEMRVTDVDARERDYREHYENNSAVQRLREAMDEWCAVWFWPMDEESAKHVPTPARFHERTPERAATIEHLRHELRFFHWEVEFPDVFTPERQGFDAVLGNPPWETVQQESIEFFTEYDPVYRTYDKQTALRRQKELFELEPESELKWLDYCGRFAALNNYVRACGTPFDMTLDRGNKGTTLRVLWHEKRATRVGYTSTSHPFIFQGKGKTYTYKSFVEVCYALLNCEGRVGLIVPSGLYSDQGSDALRELFLEESTWEWLFSFENKNRVFDIHRSFKFGPTIVGRTRNGAPMKAAFMVHDLQDWDRPDPPVFEFDRGLIPLFSPRSKSLPEVRTARDLDICRKIYDHSFRIGDNVPGWEIDYAQEFNMTTDSKHFKPREWWEARGYKPDVFGRWIGPDGDVALPLYEGRMIGQFDFSEKGYVSGRGRSAVWREIPFDDKRIEPQYLMGEKTFRANYQKPKVAKLAFMDITSSTNARTMIAVAHQNLPFGNSAPILNVRVHEILKTLLLGSTGNSLSFDYATRQRTSGLHLNWFIISECPIPRIKAPSLERPGYCRMSQRGQKKMAHRFNGGHEVDRPIHNVDRLIRNAARLTFIHRRFAPEWLYLMERLPGLESRRWKHWWAVTEADRLRLRVEIDAICADLYGLDPDDFDWILRDDPSDPKGFFRVDKELPYRERLTGLAANAFRALKEDKWSAETVGELSNDEFFEILGIPELTSHEAAKAEGLDGPLIHKRRGCHAWHPERFTDDDPRYGWTWKDCWNDAIALLGSENAVVEYIAGENESPPEQPNTQQTPPKEHGTLWDG